MTIPIIARSCIPRPRLCQSARVWSAVTLAVWGTVVVVGFVLLLNHQSLAGRTAGVPRKFPDNAAALHLAPGPKLLMFAHPHCPCTRASLQELSNLLAHAGDVSGAHVIFPRFAQAEDTALRSVNVQWALRTQGVQVTWDDEGQLAALFGVQTSGQVLLYDAQSRLLFSGGITPLRGHEGASSGSAAILAHLRGEAAPATAPVFGCSLLSPGTKTEQAARS